MIKCVLKSTTCVKVHRVLGFNVFFVFFVFFFWGGGGMGWEVGRVFLFRTKKIPLLFCYYLFIYLFTFYFEFKQKGRLVFVV